MDIVRNRRTIDLWLQTLLEEAALQRAVSEFRECPEIVKVAIAAYPTATSPEFEVRGVDAQGGYRARKYALSELVYDLLRGVLP